MSLINEALKRAQAQHQGSSPPVPGSLGPPSTPAVGRPSESTRASASSSSSPSPLWPIALAFLGVAVLFAAGAALIVWGLMRGQETADENPAVIPQTPAAEVVVAPPAAEQAVEPAEPLPTAEADLPVAEPPIAFPRPDEPVRALHAGSTAAETPAAADAVDGEQSAEPPTSENEPSSPAPQGSSGSDLVQNEPTANPLVEAFLTRIEVRGIMSGDKKVLLFDQNLRRSQAYVPGATVSNELQLKIKEINERRITFVDHDGFVYTKQF